ncbi:gametocyte-specific factor 1-like [Dipodomys spectabilis]|uniref:gametocyte-specific factor 1-like n=1 Tax=Dipodomys spectabilis TaxID=105255 RepID=UPI001C548718|nr:gametocyte-specific factor 1-like [Dipodomys spectabilis]
MKAHRADAMPQSPQAINRARNHPDIAAKLATCPFNAHHLVPRDQLSEYIATCMDKTSLEDDVDNIIWNEKQYKSSESTWKYVSSEDDWDKVSLEDPSTSFVWGTIKSTGNKRLKKHIQHKTVESCGSRDQRRRGRKRIKFDGAVIFPYYIGY